MANDNLGNALADVGRFDEALECYEEGSLHERDPKGLMAIRNNRANVLRLLGEQHSAARAQQEVIATIERAGITTGRDLGLALDNAALT